MKKMVKGKVVRKHRRAKISLRLKKKDSKISKNILNKKNIKNKPDFVVSIKTSLKNPVITHFNWIPKLSVHENTIDGQHKRLLNYINKLIKELSRGSGDDLRLIRETISFLGKYIDKHFSYEENYMIKIKYPGLERHKKIHQDFIKFYKNYQKELKSVLLSKPPFSEKLKQLTEKAKKFLGEWWVNHMAIEDHKYAKYAMKKSPQLTKVGGRQKINQKKMIQQLAWTPKISVHEETIDSQHQLILNEIQKIEKELFENEPLSSVRESIHFLSQYIRMHLAYEEEYMQKIKYPQLESHKGLHKGFIKSYEKFNREFALDLINVKDARGLSLEYLKKVQDFLGNWWINHISIADHRYFEYAKKKNLLTPPKQIKNKDAEKQKEEVKKSKKFEMSSIKSEIEQQLKSGKIKPHEAQILEQRAPVTNISKLELEEKKGKKGEKEYAKTGIHGFDELFENGIPKGNSILVAGGAGSGKTIFCLQTLINNANEGKKCYYMSFEESEDRLKQHMNDFGWDAEKMIKSNKLRIQRASPFDITRNVDALLAKQKGELLIDIEPVILPKDFKPDFVVVDSLTAVASAFTGREDSYRVYIEQLFRFFEKIGATTFLITETQQIPEIFSTTGVEEFLADGVIVLYNIKRGDVRESAIEILKMRGEKHQKKIVAMQITNEGIVVYPEQEVFSEM